MTLLVIIIVLALVFDYINGFHDAANSIATIVSTKVLTPFQAVLWAAMFNFVAFFIFKDHGVANTIAKTVKESYITLQVVLAGLSAAIIWNLITWWFGIPSSSSHTLIGGFAGAAIANAGFYAINMGPVMQIVAFIFLAPLLGMIMALIISLWFINAFRKSIWPKVFSLGLIALTIITLSRIMEFDPAHLKSHYESYIWKVIFHSHNFKLLLLALIVTIMCVFTLYLSRLNAHRSTVWFKKLQLVSSAAFSIGHGGNDAQKVMGIITVALISHGSIQTFEEMPYWVPISCY
ncbi:MAG TPA: inorganic phosphate transporter, partial [Agriterribacter sp.]|nr:inorganic phosphate transporter [Agriterribacter sp.]